MEHWYIWFLAVAGIADLITTWYAIKDGAEEQNPIAKLFGNSDRAVMYTASASKIIGILIIGLVLKPPIATCVATAIGLIWLVLGAFNNGMRIVVNNSERRGI